MPSEKCGREQSDCHGRALMRKGGEHQSELMSAERFLPESCKKAGTPLNV